MRSTVIDEPGSGAARPVPPAPPEAVVDAFGVAWSTFTLYEHPQRVEAFARAVSIMGRCPRYPWRVEVGPEGFILDEQSVGHRREATLRLAQRIFALGTAALELATPPSAEDVLTLFGLLAAPEPPTEPGAALQRLGVHSIALLHRELFGSGSSGDGGKPWYLSYDGNPEPFVHKLLEGRESDASGVAVDFVAEYQRVHELIDSADPWGREEMVHAFMDAFWYLPQRHQAEVFEQLLQGQESAQNLELLDQFGSQELAELNRLFGAAGHPLLAEYARVASDQGGRELSDIAPLVEESSEADSISKAVMDHISQVLSAIDPGGTPAVAAALDRLRSIRPRPADAWRSAVNVIGGLIDLEIRGEEVERPVELWADKIVAALGSGDLIDADRWLTAPGRLRLDPETRTRLLRTLSGRMDQASTNRIVAVLMDERPDGSGSNVRKVAPLFAADALVTLLGAEERQAKRRLLIRALIQIAAVNPGALLPHLRDPRWYLVRNIALILGACGHAEIAPRLSAVLHHDDHRVRVEALSSWSRLDPAGSVLVVVAGLDDPNEAVRKRADELLGRIDHPSVDAALIDRLERATHRGGMIAAIHALGRRGTPAARQVLQQRAARRFPFWGTTRAVRRTARAALEGRHE